MSHMAAVGVTGRQCRGFQPSSPPARSSASPNCCKSLQGPGGELKLRADKESVSSGVNNTGRLCHRGNLLGRAEYGAPGGGRRVVHLQRVCGKLTSGRLDGAEGVEFGLPQQTTGVSESRGVVLHLTIQGGLSGITGAGILLAGDGGELELDSLHGQGEVVSAGHVNVQVLPVLLHNVCCKGQQPNTNGVAVPVAVALALVLEGGGEGAERGRGRCSLALGRGEVEQGAGGERE